MRIYVILSSTLMLLMILLLLSVPAMADPQSVQFVRVGGEHQNGYYTYPYYLTLNRGPAFAMVCDDFKDRVSSGDTWQATITDLSSGDVSNTLFGDLKKYQEVGYLLLQMKSYNSDQWGNINWAIWEIFDPGIDPGYQYKQGVDYWFNQAETVDLSTIDFSGIKIVTPTHPGPQEFVFIAPEPGTLLLLGAGVLGIWARRKRLL